MAIAKVSCIHCQRRIGVDTAKLPAGRTISFKCPGCGGTVKLDPASVGAPVAPTVVEPEPEAPPLEAELGAPVAEPLPGPEPPSEDLDLPPGTTLPPGLITGGDQNVVEQLRAALAPFDSHLEVMRDFSGLVELPSEEIPPLLVCVAGTVGRPPVEAARPFRDLAPNARRRTFAVLVSDNLKTNDGSAAFAYDVNLVINSSDLADAPRVLNSALQYHRRLWGTFLGQLDAEVGE
jgi:hypothetical protein